MNEPSARDRRTSIRFDKVFHVTLESEDFGELRAVARNISVGGMLIETSFPLPLGSIVRVHFEVPDSQASVVVIAEVKNHYAFNYADDSGPRAARGMGVRFVEFVEDSHDQLAAGLSRFRTLH